jgi:predicted TIM-barrel fold metal-dependent hydrolase
MGYIDTDTHIIDFEDCWDYLEPSERQYRPTLVEAPPLAPGLPPRQMYLIGETFCRRFPADCRPGDFGTEYTPEISELRDVSVRLRKMDALGIDVQILMSTNFIAAEISNPLAEAAIMRSWNRWAAENTKDAKGRLRWVLVCPSLTIERAIEEMEFGAANGAVGVMLKGIEHNMFLSDPYFFPIYERAEKLGLTIVVHQGAAREHIEGLGITNFKQSPAASVHYTATVIKGFYAVLASDINERFPNLRFAFVESGTTWLPYVFHHYQRVLSVAWKDSYTITPRGPSRQYKPLDPEAEVRKRNMYVSTETDEDIGYIVSLIGEDNITCGTDMCHNDNGSDPLAHTIIMERSDLDPRIARKIVDTNGRRAFGIPDDFRPADAADEGVKRATELAIL